MMLWCLFSGYFAPERRHGYSQQTLVSELSPVLLLGHAAHHSACLLRYDLPYCWTRHSWWYLCAFAVSPRFVPVLCI